MISKSDVTDWFKTLQSYKRIDTMCALLNICLPFELRFLGTCLEELGRRDSQELRGMELRVNNPQELAMDVSDCQKGEPTDIKIRRKLALHLALMRACNRNCINEIFRTLEAWGELDFTTITDCDTLEELLLVYTMAANHPVFDFEQHMKCVQIFAKIKENKLVADPVPMTSAHNPLVFATNWPACHNIELQHKELHNQPIEKIDLVQQTALQQNPLHTSQLQVLETNPPQMLHQASFPLNYAQSHLVKFLTSSDDDNLPTQITAVSVPHMLTTNHVIPEANNITTNIGLNNVGNWTMRQYQSSATSAIPQLPTSIPPSTGGGITQMKDISPAVQCTSPLISQQSSPSSSRTASPQRESAAHQQPLQPLPLPTMPLHSNSQLVSTETPNSQLQHVIRNGFNRSNNPPIMKTCNYQSTHHQQQHQHYQGVYNVATGLMYAMQNISISELPVAGHHRHQKPQQQQQLQHLHHQQQQHAQHQIQLHTPHQQHQQYTTHQQHQQHTSHQQQQHTQSQQPHPNPQTSYTAFDCKITLNSNKSTCSDSGSSIGSVGDVSPPETPSLHSNNNNPIALRVTTNTTSANINVNGAIGDNRKNYHKHPSQLNYNNKHVSLTRLNGRAEKLTNNGASNNSSNYSHQQHTPPLYADILFAPISNAASSTLMPAPTLATNNSGGNGSNSSSGNHVVAGNNNNSNFNNNVGVNTTVLITTPSAVTVSIGNVITSNSILLQTHQQQYRNSYPYHSAVAAATVQHLNANGSRPAAPSPVAPNAIMNHNVAPPSMVSQTHTTFRLPGFQLSPSSDVIFPAYHPAIGNMPFLSDVANSANITGSPSTVSAPTVSVVLRSNNSKAQQLPATIASPSPAAQLQHSPTVAILTTSQFGHSTLNLRNKPLSCYNCGSQTHNGRECQEASMEDITRSAVYKLDYSQITSTVSGNVTGNSITVAAASGATTDVSVSNYPIISNQLSLGSNSHVEAEILEKKDQGSIGVIHSTTALPATHIGATTKPTAVVPTTAELSAAAK